MHTFCFQNPYPMAENSNSSVLPYKFLYYCNFSVQMLGKRYFLMSLLNFTLKMPLKHEFIRLGSKNKRKFLLCIANFPLDFLFNQVTRYPLFAMRLGTGIGLLPQGAWEWPYSTSVGLIKIVLLLVDLKGLFKFT